MSNQFEFVMTDPAVSLKPGKSSLIRSRCMQGKNKREGSRRSQRAMRRAAATCKAVSQPVYSPTSDIYPFETVPPSLNTFALVRFASQVDTEAQGVIFKAFAYNVSNQALSPLDRCVDFDCIDSVSFHWLFADAAFLHSILFAAYAVDELVASTGSGQPGRKVVSHLRETLALLAQKMEKIDVHEDEAVLYVVINLALIAAVYGDWKAAAAHFGGLHKIVQLRGGLEFLHARPKLHFKLDRLDLAWSLSSGRAPFFLHPVVSWEQTLQPPASDTSLYQPPANWDVRLISVFRDFQHLTVAINENVQKHARHNPACFQKILSSLQSRLMHLDTLLQDPVEQLIRLALLAFLTTTFRVPGRKIPYAWIAKKLEKAYADAVDSMIKRDKVLQLWVLMVVAISVVGPENKWLQEAWKAADIAVNWDEAKKRLMSVMWIECLHDGPGKAVLQQFTSTHSTIDPH